MAESPRGVAETGRFAWLRATALDAEYLLFSERLRGKSGWPITAVAGAFLVISIIAIQRHFFGRFADSEDGSAGAQEIMSRTRRRETRRGSTAMRHQNSSGAARITPFAEEKAEMSPSRRTSTPF